MNYQINNVIRSHVLLENPSVCCWKLRSGKPEHSRTVRHLQGILEAFRDPKDAWATFHELPINRVWKKAVFVEDVVVS